jgi:cobalt-zinc-cadmium efflux system membrane fusion protein
MTKHSSASPQGSSSPLLAAAAGFAALLQIGCQQSGTAQAGPGAPAGESRSAPLAQSIELTATQIGAIRIEAVATRVFAVESESVGSVGFDEDPAVIQAESTLLAAAASVELSRRELARVQSLGEANGIAPRELEGALAADRSAAAALRAASEAVRALGVSAAQIDRMVRTGRFDPVATGPREKWVIANLPETDSPRVRTGQALRAQVPAFPDRWYPGRVSRIYGAIDPGTHRVTVRALVEDPRNELRAGMLATVIIRFTDPAPAVAIPTTAAVREGDGSMIAWVTTDRRHFTMRSLKLGLESQGQYQVLDGLKAHELVVTEGGVFLSNMLAPPPSD